MSLYGEDEKLAMILQQVQANAEHIAALHRRQTEQHEEFMGAFKEHTEIARQQLNIALGYQKWIGDPLERGTNAFRLLRNIVAWLAGIVLTIAGLKKAYDVFFLGKVD